MELRRATYDEARPLVTALDAELQQRYGGGDDVHVVATDFDGPRGILLVGCLDGQDVCCGGIRPLRDDVAELKRMYVAPAWRGQGLARALLAELLAFARSAGYREVWLETGVKQPEAVALYESAGFTAVPAFGQFADEPDARCYGIALDPS